VSLRGQVVIVTGGSRGIGRSCVLEAAALGARVVFCCREDETGRRSVESDAASRGLGDLVRGVRANVMREDDVARLFETARREFGPVTSVASNAAASLESLLVTMDTASWDEVMATNLTGGFLVARQALRTFLDRGCGGRLVLMGTLSQNGVAGNGAYAASKGGLLGLARLIARDYGASGIRANVVVPGYVDTALSATLSDHARRRLVELCPLQRSGSPDEIAAVATFLLSDAADGLNGQAVFASGGLMETPV
jgi:NAD(P)-dependent dehydrogenase (short-subunit alcohol dehydrogenase family)